MKHAARSEPNPRHPAVLAGPPEPGVRSRVHGMTRRPPLGLLLDVDGPIASPVTRMVSDSILDHLISLSAAGIPVVFNTGRSDEFIRRQVLAPMLAGRPGGLPAGARMHAICEKGAVWFSITSAGEGPIHVDESLTVPSAYADAIRDLVQRRYSAYMFFDETKRAMVSVEQNIKVDHHDYLSVQKHFDDDALRLMREFDLGVTRLEHHAPDSDDNIDFRVDPTIISTDIEAIELGKDLGAQRALELLAADGELPSAWRTMGDSRTDYAMADWLHENGYDVRHVDVRPADGVFDKPYPVLTAASLGAGDHVIHDDAGLLFLERWAEVVRGSEPSRSTESGSYEY